MNIIKIITIYAFVFCITISRIEAQNNLNLNNWSYFINSESPINWITLNPILAAEDSGGNNQFVKSAFNFSKNNFYYTSAQLKVRAGSNVLSFTLPLWVYGFENKWIKHLPVYAGYSLLF